MTISVIINVDQDVIQVNNDKDVKLLQIDFVDVSLKACWYVCWTRRHHLILKVTVSNLERGFPLVPFADSHLMVGTDEVKLSELFSSS